MYISSIMDSKIQFDLNLFSKYRTELMGMAAIMVIITHMHDNGVAMYEFVRRLTSVGASGVELFLFVSGFGLWKSCKKATNGTFAVNPRVLSSWYARRYLRILVPYILFAIPMYGILTIMDHMDGIEFLKRVSFISFWTRGWGVWYIAMLIPLYFITPFIIKLLSGNGKIIWFILLMLLTEIFAYVGFGGGRDFYYCRFMVSRLPSFLIGIVMAQAICEGEKKMSLWVILIIPLIAYFILRGVNHHFGTRFFYLWLLPLPFSTLMVWLVRRFGWLQKMCNFMGRISLEVYCTHAFVPACIVRAFSLTPSLYTYIFGVGVSILLSVGINRAAGFIIGVVSSQKSAS